MNTTQRIILYAVPWEIIAFIMLVAVILFYEKVRNKMKRKKELKKPVSL